MVFSLKRRLRDCCPDGLSCPSTFLCDSWADKPWDKSGGYWRFEFLNFAEGAQKSVSRLFWCKLWFCWGVRQLQTSKWAPSTLSLNKKSDALTLLFPIWISSREKGRNVLISWQWVNLFLFGKVFNCILFPMKWSTCTWSAMCM